MLTIMAIVVWARAAVVAVAGSNLAREVRQDDRLQRGADRLSALSACRRSSTNLEGRLQASRLGSAIEATAEEDAFSAVEREAGEGEAPSDLLEAETLVERDRGCVASVSKEPGVCGAVADPVEPSLRESRADACATLIRGDEDASEVVAAWR